MRVTQPLRFGVGLNNFGSPLRTASDVVGSAVLAEELGYSSVWFGDHLSFHVPLYECLSMMAATAVVTREVTVASGVLLGVLRHPAWVAKSVATIDALSEGRVLLGLGVGGENRAEFELADVPMAERGRRTTELMGSLREMWRPDNPHGLQPPPVQSRIPLWHGGRADAALARTARFGDGWLGAFVTPERYAERWSALLAMAADAGRALFQQADVNNDGRLSRVEFDAAREARFDGGEGAGPSPDRPSWALELTGFTTALTTGLWVLPTRASRLRWK